MSSRKAAYGAPPEEKEVVVTVDRRVLMVGGVLVLVLALLGGMWFAQRSTTQSATVTGAPVAAPAATSDGRPATIPEDIARQTAVAEGLPENVVIVPQVEPQANISDPFATARALVTPAAGLGGVSPGQAVPPSGPGGLLGDSSGTGGIEFTVDPNYRSPTENWTHDVLAGFPDPNLADAGLIPERTELVKGPLPGPRLAIGELNDLYTYDFGVVPLDQPVSKTFVATNAGDADLVISRVYTGCGCTALRIGDQKIDSAGYVKPPVVLRPGASIEFDVEYDPRAEGKTGPQAKYVQIYTNDPTQTLFDAADPNSGETRFRFVVEPRGRLASTATPTPGAP